jgi:hypothetical protein
VEKYVELIEFSDCIFTPIFEEQIFSDPGVSNFDEYGDQNWQKEEFAHKYLDYNHSSYKSHFWNDFSNPFCYLNRSFCRLDMVLSAVLPLPKKNERFVKIK